MLTAMIIKMPILLASTLELLINIHNSSLWSFSFALWLFPSIYSLSFFPFFICLSLILCFSELFFVSSFFIMFCVFVLFFSSASPNFSTGPVCWIYWFILSDPISFYLLVYASMKCSTWNVSFVQTAFRMWTCSCPWSLLSMAPSGSGMDSNFATRSPPTGGPTGPASGHLHT